MYPFVESIRIQNGVIHNLSYHNERMNYTRRELFGCKNLLDLADYIDAKEYTALTKCRVEYKKDVLLVEYTPYERKAIHSLQLIESDEIEYSSKSTDRRMLNELYAQRKEEDDILIVRKGLLTDTLFCNIALSKGENWYTPSTPLLKGTARTFLLEKGIIQEKEIPVASLFFYERITLFNAMIDFKQIEFSVNNIKPL
ncbi:MAG: aminotransferase class IV family protein [Tannerellaceae bacterium]|nr:aminotransferase class IV family protein [Tannerellaceae bacterium]